MINKNYFVYLHIRPDKGQVFYVGRGKRYSKCSPTYRAYDKRKRNKQWCSIVDRNNGEYEAIIACWCETLSEVLEKEKEYISKHGKQIDNTGTLINLTDGGDGSLGLKHTDEAKNKMSNALTSSPERMAWIKSDKFKLMRSEKMRGISGSMLGKKHSSETINKFKAMRSGSNNVNAKKVIDIKTGDIFGCVEDAAISINIGKWSLYKYLGGCRSNPTDMRYA